MASQLLLLKGPRFDDTRSSTRSMSAHGREKSQGGRIPELFVFIQTVWFYVLIYFLAFWADDVFPCAFAYMPRT